MPIRVPLVTDPAPVVLLDGLVDYAGLFPPAARPMAEAVRRYARHRVCSGAFMLGRFICPVARLGEFTAEAEPLLPRDEAAVPWVLAVTGSGDHAADAAAIAAFNTAHTWGADEHGAVIDVVEVKAGTPDGIAAIDAAFPRSLTVYVEIPVDADPAPLVAATRRRAKIRTGGVTADAFPSPDEVLRFLAACVEAGVPFKATAGLHHPLRGRYRLTYAPDAPTGEMYGFLNVLLAAAFLADGLGVDAVRPLLLESDPSSLAFDEEGVRWREHVLSRERLQQVRERVMTGFGSCSFTEPSGEVRALGAW